MPGGGGKGGPPGPGGIIPGGKPGPGGKGGRAAGSGKGLNHESSGSFAGLTSTKSRRGSTESTRRRTHAHGGPVHRWWGTKVLRTETETPRRGPAARFISGRNLINNALSLVVS